MRPAPVHDKRCGFTLVELLVAAAITAALAALLLAAVVQVLGLWDRSGGAAETAAEAGRILDQVAVDLEALVLRPDGNAWLAATIQRDQSGAGDSGMTAADWTGSPKPTGADSLRVDPPLQAIEAMRFGQAGVWLRFFTVEPDANDSATNRSLPRAVAYQLVRRRTGGRFTYQLFRSQVRPGGANSTFSSGYDLFATAYVTGNGSEQHPGNVRRPNARFLLGDRVVDFGLRIESRGPAGAVAQAFPDVGGPGQSFVATAGMSPVPGYAGSPVVRGWPVRFEVMVRILSGEGARQVDHLESGRIPVPSGESHGERWWRLVEANSHVYVRTVVPRARVP